MWRSNVSSKHLWRWCLVSCCNRTCWRRGSTRSTCGSCCRDRPWTVTCGCSYSSTCRSLGTARKTSSKHVGVKRRFARYPTNNVGLCLTHPHDFDTWQNVMLFQLNVTTRRASCDCCNIDKKKTSPVAQCCAKRWGNKRRYSPSRDHSRRQICESSPSD